MTDALENVIEQMTSEGLTGLQAVDLVANGKIQRFRPDWEPVKSKKRAWYVLFSFRLSNGDLIYSGGFGWFVGAESHEFNIDVKASVSLSRDDRVRFDQDQFEKRRLAELESQSKAEQDAAKALRIWNGCSVQGHSQYAQRKRVACVDVRFSRGSLVIPVQDFDGNLHGLQFIAPDGAKKFLTGTRKKGHFCLLGFIDDPLGFVGVAEGWATGVSCYMATQWPIFVAFDAGNLQPVALAIRARYCSIKIVIFADDDISNPDNPGRRYAASAARVVGGVVLFPPAVEVCHG